MEAIGWLIYLSGCYPLWVAWRANRQSALVQSVNWAVVAWSAWGGVLAAVAGPGPGAGVVSYVALCLIGCAGVAVLGARRPGVGAWNFVVVALLAVMLLPLAERLAGAPDAPLGLRRLFLGFTLAVGVLNYLPTRLAPAALLLAAGCAVEIGSVSETGSSGGGPGLARTAGRMLVASGPWVAYGLMRWQPRPASEFDRRWLDFRNRFGLFWGQRLREQFNRAAANAGWPVHLRWQGLRLKAGVPLPGPAMQEAMLERLRALLKRFGP
jgi:hypothetical protein